jgi:hypothetical protein
MILTSVVNVKKRSINSAVRECSPGSNVEHNFQSLFSGKLLVVIMM